MNKELKFSKELDFSKWLTNYLNNSTLYNKTGESTSITTEHNKSKKNGRPDVKVTTECKLLLHKYTKNRERFLSDPFYIECKMNRKGILYWLQQFIRYKIKLGSEKHLSSEKYGDFHITVTIPEWLEKDNTLQIKKDMGGYTLEAYGKKDENYWLNNFVLVRVLWHLGLGVLYSTPTPNNKKRLKIAFNHKEVLNVYPNK